MRFVVLIRPSLRGRTDERGQGIRMSEEERELVAAEVDRAGGSEEYALSLKPCTVLAAGEGGPERGGDHLQGAVEGLGVMDSTVSI